MPVTPVRSRRSWAAVLAAFGAVGALACGCGGHGSSDQKGADRPVALSTPAAGTPVDVPVNSQIMNLPLETSAGRPTTLAAYRDKIIVISDAMTLCQETCPLDTANLVQMARQANKAGLGDKVVYLSITVDPARDTPPQLAAYRKLFTPVPDNWVTLTGTQANITKLWKVFGVWWKKVPQDSPPPKNWRTGKTLTYDIQHGDELFLIKGGHERYLFSGAGNVEPGTLPGKLHGFLNDSGRQNLKHPEGDSWTVPQALRALGDLTGTNISG